MSTPKACRSEVGLCHERVLTRHKPRGPNSVMNWQDSWPFGRTPRDCGPFPERMYTDKKYRSTFHGGDGHKKEHVTVEFKDKNGNHVTTHHVYGPRDAQDPAGGGAA